MRTFAAPVAATVLSQQLDAAVAHIAGDEQAAPSIAAASAVVLPPGDAQVSSTRGAGCVAGEKRDELRRFVLHDEPAVVEPGTAQRVALVHDQAVRRERGGVRPRTASAASRSHELLRRHPQAVRAERQRAPACC